MAWKIIYLRNVTSLRGVTSPETRRVISTTRLSVSDKKQLQTAGRKYMKLITLILLLIVAVGAYGEDSSEENVVIDLFEDSEQEDTVDEISEEAESNSVFNQIVANWNGESIFRYFLYFEEMEVEEGSLLFPDDKRHIFESVGEYNSHFGSDVWRVSFSFASSFGNQTDTYIPAFDDVEDQDWQDWLRDPRRERRYISVKEFYLSVFFHDVDVYIGRKLLENTLSTIYGPADVYTPIDANSPFHGGALGKYLVELDYFIGDFSIVAAIFPVYQGGKSFGPLSRWGYYSAIPESNLGWLPINQMEVKDEYPDIAWRNMSYFIRFKANLPGFDFFLSGFYGLNGNKVTKLDEGGLSLTKEIVPVVNAAAAISTTLGKLELHGEALYNYTPESRDDDYLRYVVGGRYAFDEFDTVPFIDKIDLNLEYAGEYLVTEQSHADYIAGSGDMRGLKDDFLGSIDFDFAEDFTVRVAGQYDIEGQGVSLLSGIGYAGMENLELNLKWQHFFVTESSDLYHWRDNNRIIASVRYSL